MQYKRFALTAVVAATAMGAANAATEIQWWHSMTAVNNEWVNDLAKQFNESQSEYKVVPTFKGVYDESMTAAIAAFQAGRPVLLLDDDDREDEADIVAARESTKRPTA